MKVTQVLKGRRFFYLCDKHLKISKTYNLNLIFLEIGDSNCDFCNNEKESKREDRLYKQARKQYDNL